MDDAQARLAVAIATGDLDALRAAVDDDADLDHEDAELRRPLHAAAMCPHPHVVTALLEAGASPEGRLLGQDGGTPLAVALFYARRDIAPLLADPPLPDNLRCAAALGRDLAPFVGPDGSLRAEAGSGRGFCRPITDFPPCSPSDDRQMVLDDALTYAARFGEVDAMARLVALGADVDAVPYRGTPLWWAVYADDPVSAAWLLDHGADPDLRHDFGGTDHGRDAVAMHLAAQYGALRTLELLLDRGADPSIRDGAWNATPREWAEHTGSDAAAALLAGRDRRG